MMTREERQIARSARVESRRVERETFAQTQTPPPPQRLTRSLPPSGNGKDCGCTRSKG